LAVSMSKARKRLMTALSTQKERGGVSKAAFRVIECPQVAMAESQPIRVTCPRRIITDFKRGAKAAYPRELYAVLFGAINGNSVRISDVWYPHDGDKLVGETDYLFHRKQWLEEAIAIADSEGLVIVADMHSHPGINTREPSESDWDGSPDGWVQGICAVYKGETGRKRAAVRFWPTVHPVHLHLV
jgi:proteasome lid subunit RPN8/RPN11